MRKNIFIVVFFLLISSIAYSQNYYWYNSSKVQLNDDSSMFYIKTIKTNEASAFTKAKIVSLFKINDTALSQLSDTEFIIKSDKKIDRTILNSQALNLKYNTPLFLNSNSSSIIIHQR